MKSVLFYNDRDKNVVMQKGSLMHASAMCISTNANLVSATFSHREECPLQYEVLLQSEAGMFMHLHPLCIK